MAISCKLSQNLTRADVCGYSLPEIVDIWLVNYADVDGAIAVSGSAESGAEEITGITISGNAYHVEPTKGSASFTDELVVADNGNKYRTATLTFNVAGTYNSQLHGALDALSLGRYFAVIKTADGNYLGLGRISPLEAETATLSGGEENGIQVVLSANIAESAMPLSDAAISALKDAVKA